MPAKIVGYVVAIGRDRKFVSPQGTVVPGETRFVGHGCDRVAVNRLNPNCHLFRTAKAALEFGSEEGYRLRRDSRERRAYPVYAIVGGGLTLDPPPPEYLYFYKASSDTCSYLLNCLAGQSYYDDIKVIRCSPNSRGGHTVCIRVPASVERVPGWDRVGHRRYQEHQVPPPDSVPAPC